MKSVFAVAVAAAALTGITAHAGTVNRTKSSCTSPASNGVAIDFNGVTSS